MSTYVKSDVSIGDAGAIKQEEALKAAEAKSLGK
jgi:hypothetical protein